MEGETTLNFSESTMASMTEEDRIKLENMQTLEKIVSIIGNVQLFTLRHLSSGHLPLRHLPLGQLPLGQLPMEESPLG